PIQIPIGEEAGFQGVVDLIENKALVWKDELGTEFEYTEIPADLVDAAHEHRTHLIEACADYDDELMEAYLNDEEIPHERIAKPTYFSVSSCKHSAGSRVLNASSGGKTERIGRLLMMHANHREEIEECFAGDILAGVGLKQTSTGDTLCAPDAPIVLEQIEFPEPVIAVAIEPKTKADQEKLAAALARLAEEDPTFQVQTDEETGQTLIPGMGELHLEVIVH